MIDLETKHLITGAELSKKEIVSVLDLAFELKTRRRQGLGADILKGKSLALLFDKPSLRTRFSFSVAMFELGGTVIESINATRKSEEPRDLARVLSGYCDGIMIRTFDDKTIYEMAEYSSIPVINGLSDTFHPCQILADLLTIKEQFGRLKGVKLAYVGDGNNILQSFFPVVEKTGIELSYACPKGYEPNAALVEEYKDVKKIKAYSDPYEAVKGADVIYTDVWTSMGFEEQAKDRDLAFEKFKVNHELLKAAGGKPNLLHCLPMVRGKEIAEDLPDSKESLIFKQSENRLHVQKAILIGLMKDELG